MNYYGQILLDHLQNHRPRSSPQIQNPIEFFTKAGEEVQAQVTELRDSIVGQPRSDETPEAYRLRSYQALATAEETVIANHPLLQPDPGDQNLNDETDSEEEAGNEVLQESRKTLQAVNAAIHRDF